MRFLSELLSDGRIAFRRATHQEIANRIGTTRETVTRMLKGLERQRRGSCSDPSS